MANPTDTHSPGLNRIRLALLCGCMAYVLLIAYVPGFTSQSPLVCMSNKAFGLHCPGCGLTRAFACLARLDPVAAFHCNPLVVFAAPFALVLALDTFSSGDIHRRILGWLPRWLMYSSLIALFATFGVVFVVRTATWLVPEWNPEGWLVPPDRFPPS